MLLRLGDSSRRSLWGGIIQFEGAQITGGEKWSLFGKNLYVLELWFLIAWG
jgi:hypothetical protein